MPALIVLLRINNAEFLANLLFSNDMKCIIDSRNGAGYYNQAALLIKIKVFFAGREYLLRKFQGLP